METIQDYLTMECIRESSSVNNFSNEEMKEDSDITIEEMGSEYEIDILFLDYKCTCTLHKYNNGTKTKYNLNEDNVTEDELLVLPDVIQEMPSNMKDTNDTKLISTNVTSHLCRECDANFLKKQDLKKHCKIAHPLLIQCKYCNMTFTKRSNMIRHQNRVCKLNTNEKVIQTKTKFECNECDKVFTSRQCLLTHLKTVHMGEVVCKYCNKTYTKRSNLKRHQLYFCKMNESTKENNQKYKYGMFTNPFTCDYCQKEYTHKNTLIDHMQKHLGTVKKFSCDLCSKQYTKKLNLACHIKSSHLKSKMYACQHCGLKFTWKWTLISHEKRYHSKG